MQREKKLVERKMTFTPRTVAPSDSVAHARALLDEYRISHLPVLARGKLVGMVTVRDLCGRTRRRGWRNLGQAFGNASRSGRGEGRDENQAFYGEAVGHVEPGGSVDDARANSSSPRHRAREFERNHFERRLGFRVRESRRAGDYESRTRPEVFKMIDMDCAKVVQIETQHRVALCDGACFAW
jgi:hypothetical protein